MNDNPTSGLTWWSPRRHPANASIRLRLTLLYGLLFLASGVALLAITYVLVAHRYHGGLFATSTHNVLTRAPGRPGTVKTISRVGLASLVVQSLIALAIMAAVCLWLGWLVAGRVLQPLRAMTATVREISANDLHRRLALQGPEDELRRLANAFDRLLDRLEAASEAQRRFVANASHELRTPLALQRTLVQVTLADPDANTASLREMGKDVLAVGERQERLIDALLTLSRSHAGLDRHEPIDLASVTAEAMQGLHHDGLTIEATLEPAPIAGDPELVRRLIANLLDNAALHNLPHGQIRIATSTTDDESILAVANTGPSIRPEQVAQLFEPFHRLDTPRTNSDKRLGLGLSIIEAIATAHAATLNTRPRNDGGLHVEVKFPTRHEDVER